MITFKQIKYALAVAKQLHFKKASDDCFVSPSTLSNSITELEFNIGFKIFERSNKKVIITKLGLEFLNKAKKINLQVKNINEMKLNYLDSMSYPISMGIIPTISPYFLPIALPRIKNDFPNLPLEIEESESKTLIDKVKEGDLDMAILALPYALGDLVYFKFWAEDFYLVSNKKNELSNKNEIHASELQCSKLMLLEDGHCLKDHILKACNIDIKSKYSLKASSLQTLIQLVKGDMGSTLIPKMAINQLIRTNNNLSIAHLNEPGPHREICIVTRKDYWGLENIKLLCSIFSEEMHKNDYNND